MSDHKKIGPVSGLNIEELEAHARRLAPKTIGQITFKRPLSDLNIEELAAHTSNSAPSMGVLFARTSGEREQKDAAREQVLELFRTHAWPESLHMLTMPGADWRFERLLLGNREEKWTRKRQPRGTYFTCCESDRALYRASVVQMPGLYTEEAEVKAIRSETLRGFAEAGVKTRYASIFFANVDDLMAQNIWDGWDAVWLDYTSTMTPRRLAIISQFYRCFVKSILVITVCKGRWGLDTARAVEAAGGHSQWLRNHLPGEVIHDFEYGDTSTMTQFAVRKGWRSPLV